MPINKLLVNESDTCNFFGSFLNLADKKGAVLLAETAPDLVPVAANRPLLPITIPQAFTGFYNPVFVGRTSVRHIGNL